MAASLAWVRFPLGYASSGETRLAGLTGEGLGLGAASSLSLGVVEASFALGDGSVVRASNAVVSAEADRGPSHTLAQRPFSMTRRTSR